MVEIAVVWISPLPDFAFYLEDRPHVEFHTCHVCNQFTFPCVRSEAYHLSEERFWAAGDAVEGLVVCVMVEEADDGGFGENAALTACKSESDVPPE